MPFLIKVPSVSMGTEQNFERVQRLKDFKDQILQDPKEEFNVAWKSENLKLCNCLIMVGAEEIIHSFLRAIEPKWTPKRGSAGP